MTGSSCSDLTSLLGIRCRVKREILETPEYDDDGIGVAEEEEEEEEKEEEAKGGEGQEDSEWIYGKIIAAGWMEESDNFIGGPWVVAARDGEGFVGVFQVELTDLEIFFQPSSIGQVPNS